MEGARPLRFAVLSRHLPDPEGTAAGRILSATCEGLIAEGHSVEAFSWGPEPPSKPLPAWSEWRRVDPALDPISRIRAVIHPRNDAARAAFSAESDAVAVADDPLSFAGVESSRAPVVTIHYLTKIDARVLARRRATDIQDRRAEARACRRAALTLAYSERVAENLSSGATFVPIAYPIPAEPLPFVEEPVAGVLADWRWTPNHIALERLLRLWPEVRERVPTARLLLAGQGLERRDPSDGIEVLGVVPESREVLAQAAVLPFPVPATSGPKVKVLEALVSGLTVLTTPAGLEGLAAGDGAIVSSDRRSFASELAAVLVDPARRRALGDLARRSASAAHAPRAVARRRAEVIARSLDVS